MLLETAQKKGGATRSLGVFQIRKQALADEKKCEQPLHETNRALSKSKKDEPKKKLESQMKKKYRKEEKHRKEGEEWEEKKRKNDENRDTENHKIKLCRRYFTHCGKKPTSAAQSAFSSAHAFNFLPARSHHNSK